MESRHLGPPWVSANGAAPLLEGCEELGNTSLTMTSESAGSAHSSMRPSEGSAWITLSFQSE